MPIQITQIASTFYLRYSRRLLNTVYPQFLNADFMIFNLLKFAFVRIYIRNKIKQLNIEVYGVKSCFSKFYTQNTHYIWVGCWVGFCFFLGFQGLVLDWVLSFFGFLGFGFGLGGKRKTQPKNPKFEVKLFTTRSSDIIVTKTKKMITYSVFM